MKKVNPFVRNMIIGIVSLILLLSTLILYLSIENDRYAYTRNVGVSSILSHLNGYRKKLIKGIKAEEFPRRAAINYDQKQLKEDMLFSKDNEMWCIIDKKSFLITPEIKIDREESYVPLKDDFGRNPQVHKIDENTYVQDPVWILYVDEQLTPFDKKHYAPYKGILKILTNDYYAVIYLNCSDPADEKCIDFVCDTVIDFINNNVIDIATIDPAFLEIYP